MSSTGERLKSIFPSGQWLSKYSFDLFKKDAAAGLNVLVILIPQGMAYAMLAGVPPIYGLYAGIVPLLIYAIFGTSMHLSIGPAAISSLLLMEGISQVAEPETADFIKYVLLTGLIVGIFQLLFGLLRLGFWIRFLSRPVIIGFTSAAALIIATSQFKYLFGFDIPRFPSLMQSWQYVIQNISQFHLLTFIICISGIAIIYFFKKIHRSIPGGLIAALIAIGFVYFLSLQDDGVAIVGELPQGLPSFIVPQFSWADIQVVLPTSILLAFLSMVESVSIAKFWSNKSETNYFDANKELIAYGLSKIGGAFFQALPASGSNSRSAVNFTSGAQTQMSSIISVIFMSVTLLYFSHLFYYLPKAILAAIILLAVTGLFSYKEIKGLWKIYRPDFWIAIVTFLATLILGVRDGIIIGTIYAVLSVLLKIAKPKITQLGLVPNTEQYQDLSKFPEAAPLPRCLMIRFQRSLYYFNVLYFTEYIEKIFNESEEDIDCIFLDISGINEIDSSGIDTLCRFQKNLADKNIKLYFSGLSAALQSEFSQKNLLSTLGIEKSFYSLHEAVQHYQSENNNRVVAEA